VRFKNLREHLYGKFFLIVTCAGFKNRLQIPNIFEIFSSLYDVIDFLLITLQNGFQALIASRADLKTKICVFSSQSDQRPDFESVR